MPGIPGVLPYGPMSTLNSVLTSSITSQPFSLPHSTTFPSPSSSSSPIPILSFPILSQSPSPSPSFLPVPFLSKPSAASHSSPCPSSSPPSIAPMAHIAPLCNISSSSRLLKQSIRNPNNGNNNINGNGHNNGNITGNGNGNTEHSVYRRTFCESDDVSVLNLTILLGNPGTGKSTAADYFKQGAKKRNLHTVFIEACESDITIKYGIISRIFWGLLDPFNACETLLQKISYVDEILLQLAECSSASEEHSGDSFDGNLLSAENMERSSTKSSKSSSTRNVLLKILGLECSTSRGSFGLVEERSHVTVLDRRMSNTSTAPKGKYIYTCLYVLAKKMNFVFLSQNYSSLFYFQLFIFISTFYFILFYFILFCLFYPHCYILFMSIPFSFLSISFY